MKFLLDTMVISEPGRPRPEPRVLAWLGSHPAVDMAISVCTLGEVAKGVELMTEGRRKRELAAWLTTELPELFRDRVVWIDQRVALEWGRLSGRRSGLPVVDGLLLATAFAHRLTLVTRNVRDTAGLGVPILDPWSGRRYDGSQADT